MTNAHGDPGDRRPAADPASDELTRKLRELAAHAQGRARGEEEAELEQARLVQLAELNNELSRAQRELAIRNHELADLNERKNQFLGMVAHDLRNPLGAIRGFADLLDASALEAGQLTLCMQEQVDVADVVTRSVDLQRTAAGQKQIELVVRRAEHPVVQHADPHKLQQVITNLVTNAIKYSHAGTTVTITVTSDEGVTVLTVADQGQGMSREDLDELFQPYGTASVEATAGERSIGLGLTIVKAIVEGHHGAST